MKKIIAIVSTIFLISFLFGCNKSGNNVNSSNNNNNVNEEAAPEALSIKDYFPIKENTKYVYEGIGNEYASYNVYTDYTSENKVQQRINNGGTEVAKVIELKDGKITKLLSRGEAYYRENLLDVKDDDEILLMEPLAKGTSWKLKDSKVRTITDISKDVTTPSGNYKAIEVVTEGDNYKTMDYYAKDVGLVKSIFVSGESEVISTLSKVEENVPLVQKISFFYPNVADDKIYYKDIDISFNTNDVTRQVIAAAYKESINNNLGKVFSQNTQINSLYLNKDGRVYIDLNKAFSTEMNAGSGYESMILQCIANTFGKYYNAEKIILTVDNAPYTSGHIIMEKGQFIKVNYKNAIEVK
ncbi:MAG: GerMN domain-containing protein [Clostridiaceae bacterium]